MSLKKIVSLILSALICLSAFVAFPASASADELPKMEVNAKASLLMEPVTGKVLLEHNAHAKLPPASVTKVMTILLIYEALAQDKISWNDMVTVSEHAASMGGSQVYLAPMEQQSVTDLVKSVVIASANDAAVAMAEYIAGSEDGFVTMMNSRAAELGMADTRFANACGLPTAGHLTSAYDIALMSRELITKYPEVFKYTKIWMDKITHKTSRGEEDFGLTNTNKLIKSYPAATGLKTGSTNEALFCISATAERNGLQLIAVILGAPDPGTRFGEAIKMMDYGFANYALVPGDPAGTVLGRVSVQKGGEEEVNAVVKARVAALVTKGKSTELKKDVRLAEAVYAPVKAGAKVGEVIYYHENAEVGRSDLIAQSGVEKATLRDMIGRAAQRWFVNEKEE
ncbi:MAG: D-alanyl-D-alanine carboxypeptidase [Firmicutes bacterium]|nr:D-alanyl-D-alanine carboxypeptidase [Bacillota bacterium]